MHLFICLFISLYGATLKANRKGTLQTNLKATFVVTLKATVKGYLYLGVHG